MSAFTYQVYLLLLRKSRQCLNRETRETLAGIRTPLSSSLERNKQTMVEFFQTLQEAGILTSAFIIGTLAVGLSIIGRVQAYVQLTPSRAIILACFGVILMLFGAAGHFISVPTSAPVTTPSVVEVPPTLTHTPVEPPTPTPIETLTAVPTKTPVTPPTETPMTPPTEVPMTTSTETPTAAPTEVTSHRPKFGPISFCLQVDYDNRCISPTNHFPSGITRFYVSWSFQDVPLGTRFHRIWYRDGKLIEELTHLNTIWDERWNSPTGVEFTWVQETEYFKLVDGQYKLELYFEGESEPIQQATVQIGP